MARLKKPWWNTNVHFLLCHHWLIWGGNAFENSRPATEFIRQLLRRVPGAVLQLFFRKYCKKYLLLQNNRYFLELMAGFEPATYWLRTVRNPLQPLLYKDFRPFFIPKEWGRTRSVPLFPCVRFPVWVMVWVRRDYVFAPCKNALRNSRHEVVVQSQKSVILFAVSMLHTQKLRRDRQRIVTIRPFNNL